MNEIHNRSLLLLGEDAMQRMAQCRVLLFGVGGVGSWCAESLIRTGIQRLTIVDADCVCITNVNRQLMATTRTVGVPKVEALRERLLEINPEAEITAIRDIYNEENSAAFQLDSYDYIIDCIDSLKDKTHLLYAATHTRAKVFSSMGAALKLDPTRIQVAEFWRVQGCPLARALRQRLKKNKMHLGKKVPCVFSDEVLSNRGGNASSCIETDTFQKAQVNGSLAHITATYGFTLAGLVIQDIYKKGE